MERGSIQPRARGTFLETLLDQEVTDAATAISIYKNVSTKRSMFRRTTIKRWAFYTNTYNLLANGASSIYLNIYLVTPLDFCIV
jgi:hypothetical protein